MNIIHTAKIKIMRVTIWSKKVILKLLNQLINIMILVSAAFMIVATVILVSFTCTQVFIALNMQVNTTAKSITDFFLKASGLDPQSLTNEKYLLILPVVIGSTAVLVTLWFAIVTVMKHLKYKIELEKKSLIKREKIIADGIDDLDTMYKYYKNADSVIVFSGDFSWLTKHEKLNQEVMRLAQESKISFVSYKSVDTVKSCLGTELFGHLEKLFTFGKEKEIKCSLVQIGISRVFLYRADRSAEGGEKNVCIISGQEDAQYLLQTLSNLCQSYAPRR